MTFGIETAMNVTVATPTAVAPTSLWQPINLVQILFGCIGMVGNSLVCITIARRKSLQNLTNHFIASLAITDLISSFLWIVSVFSRRFPPSGHPVVRHFQCVVVEAGYVFWISILASTYHLVAITLERLFAIVYPVRHRLVFSRKWATVAIAVSWILPFAILANFPIFHKVVDGICVYVVTKKEVFFAYGVFLFIATYLLPLVTMAWAYIKMWKCLKQNTLQSNAPGAGLGQPYQASTSRNRARRKVVQMLLIVFVTFVVCWTPDQIMVLMNNTGAVSLTLPQFMPVMILALCNSCANPFIYAFKNKHYRDGFREIFCFGRSAAQVRVGPTLDENDSMPTGSVPTAATADLSMIPSSGTRHAVDTTLGTSRA